MDTQSGVRAAVERWSAVPVVFLYRLPRWSLLVAVFLLLVVGMVGTGWVGALGLVLLLVFLGWFAYLNWPKLDTPGRLLRLFALAVLAAGAVARLVG